MEEVKKTMGMYEYAKHRGVTHRTIMHYIENGILTAFERTGYKYTIFVDEADAQLQAGHDGTKSRPTVSGESAEVFGSKNSELGDMNNITAAKTQKEKYAAELKKLEYEEKVGTLVKKADVYKELFEMGKELRQELQALPDRIIDDILAQRTRHDAHRVLSEAVNTMLERVTELEKRDI